MAEKIETVNTEATELLLGKEITPGLISQRYFQQDGTLVRLINIGGNRGLVFSQLAFSREGVTIFSLTVQEANEQLSLEDPTEDPDKETFFIPSWNW